MTAVVIGNSVIGAVVQADVNSRKSPQTDEPASSKHVPMNGRSQHHVYVDGGKRERKKSQALFYMQVVK